MTTYATADMTRDVTADLIADVTEVVIIDVTAAVTFRCHRRYGRGKILLQRALLSQIINMFWILYEVVRTTLKILNL